MSSTHSPRLDCVAEDITGIRRRFKQQDIKQQDIQAAGYSSIFVQADGGLVVGGVWWCVVVCGGG